MLRNIPRLKYCGLTIIMSNPSRFDRVALLTANGGALMNRYLQPDFNLMQCEIRLMEDKSPFMKGTKGIMLLGESAMHEWCPDTRNNTLNEMRGSPLLINNIPAIASFFPQDAAELGRHEQKINKLSKEYVGTDNEDDDDDNEESGDISAKSHSNTQRKNYAFWLKSDTDKIKFAICKGSWPKEQEPIFKLYPPSDEVINVLSNIQNSDIIFDIETDVPWCNMQCFAFSIDSRIVYSVPILDCEYKWAYSTVPEILRALVVAFSRNRVIGHNIAAFDLMILAMKYHIPFKKAYDTMMAQHRIFPDAERSLGHCISYKWLYEKFHKDTDSKGYHTQEQLMARLKYCGRDVYTTGLVFREQQKILDTIPGLRFSVDTAMRSIRPYIITSLQGVRYSKKRLEEICKENDRLMMQYIRMIEILIGPEGMKEVQSAIKGKKKGAFPGSNKQCVKYFHDILKYPVLFKSPKTGAPSLGKKLMYKLALKHKNPVITFTLLYRIIAKEYGSLKFHPFRDDNNKIIPFDKNYAKNFGNDFDSDDDSQNEFDFAGLGNNNSLVNSNLKNGV